MINRKPTGSLNKFLPLLCASAIFVTGCSGEQAGDTNAGMSGGLAGGVSGATVLGVAGGVLLAGVLLDSDDDDSSSTVVGGDSNVNNGGTDGGGTDGGGTDGGGTDGGGTDGGGTDGVGTDGGGTDGGGTDGGGTNGGGATGSDVLLSDAGVFQTQLVESEAVPPTGSAATGNADLLFDRSTGDVSGTVTLSGITATRVDIMAGPPGSNGFVAVALEMLSPNVWSVPSNLSAQQQAFVLQNLNSGNLYVAARSAEYPNGEIRRQITPAGVSRYTTTDTSDSGGNAQGYLLVNENTGDYSITWNTTDNTLASAHVNDGVVSGSTENNYAPLTQRTSNPAQFFMDGNFNNAADPLYPDLLQRLGNGTVWLDAHAADDTRVFFGQLN